MVLGLPGFDRFQVTFLDVWKQDVMFQGLCDVTNVPSTFKPHRTKTEYHRLDAVSSSSRTCGRPERNKRRPRIVVAGILVRARTVFACNWSEPLSISRPSQFVRMCWNTLNYTVSCSGKAGNVSSDNLTSVCSHSTFFEAVDFFVFCPMKMVTF